MLKCKNHEVDFKEVSKDKIEQHLLCPLCNHWSIITLTTKQEADETNKNIRLQYEAKLTEWNKNGKVGSKPRIQKTESQVLGCVCFTQNCIGNADGSGCFEC